jgi:hypothetical protein
VNAVRLIRNFGGARVSSPGIPLSPPGVPPLGPDWWTGPWTQETRVLDERVELLYQDLKRGYKRVKQTDAPLGTEFFRLNLGERIPTSLWQAILSLPDEFAHGDIVLRKLPDGSVRVCDPAGETVGMLDAKEMLRPDYYYEWSAYWILAATGATPLRIRETLKRHLP